MKRVTINVTDEQFDELQKIITEKDSDISKQIRKAIDLLLRLDGTIMTM